MTDAAIRETLPAVTRMRGELAKGNYNRAYNGFATGLGSGGFYNSEPLGRVFGVLPTDEEYAASSALDEAHKAMLNVLRPVADGEAEADPAAISAAVDAWADALVLHESGKRAHEGRVEEAIAVAEERIARGETPLPAPSEEEIAATFQRLGIDPDPDAKRDYYVEDVFRSAQRIRKHEELRRQTAELSDPEYVKAVRKRDKQLAAARKAFEDADQGNLYERESRWADYLAANHPELEAVQCEPTFDGGALWKTLRSNARDQKAAKPNRYLGSIMDSDDTPQDSFIRCDRIGEVMAMHQKPSSPREFEHGNLVAGAYQVVHVNPTVYLHGGKTYQMVAFAPLGKHSPANATYLWGESVHEATERAARA